MTDNLLHSTTIVEPNILGVGIKVETYSINFSTFLFKDKYSLTKEYSSRINKSSFNSIKLSSLSISLISFSSELITIP